MVQNQTQTFVGHVQGHFPARKGSSLSRQEDPGLVPSEAPRPLGEGDMVNSLDLSPIQIIWTIVRKELSKLPRASSEKRLFQKI